MALQSFDASWRYQCPKTGLMLPWYTKGALEWLLSQPINNWSVLEIGVGYSSAWYKANARYWTGIENSPVWREAFEAAKNLEHLSFNSFDLIVVDEDTEINSRYDNLIKAINSQAKFIIVDNWMQPSVPVDWKDAPEIISKLKHVIHKEEGHPDWQTLIIDK